MQKNKAPFLRTRQTSASIMQTVLLALIPVVVMAVVHFGPRVLLMLAVSTISAVQIGRAHV